MWIWAFGAAFAGKWDGAVSDIAVSKVVPAPAEAVHALLIDWHAWQDALPIDCAQQWEILGDRTGLGARSTALYTFGPMRRRLEGVITKETPGQLIETELAGKSGWFTQVTYAPAEGGTLVTLTSPVTRPKWPLTGVYFDKVKPAWEACYTQALTKLAERLGS